MADLPSLRIGIDRAWLVSAARRDPLEHAYGLWDLDHEPVRAQFVSLATEQETVAYLILWDGRPYGTAVHWIGSDQGAEPLLEALPRGFRLAVVPDGVAPAVRERMGPGVDTFAILSMLGPRTLPQGLQDSAEVHLVDRRRAPALRAWANALEDPFARGYRDYDPVRQRAWAVYDGARIVGAASAAARLPELWVIAGVFVTPDARGRGFGRALTSRIMAEAIATGARPGLYVREHNASARRVYERLGFTTVARRTGLELREGAAERRAPSAS